jgi:pimeloyl-ACP methyl ester carboxylesterase
MKIIANGLEIEVADSGAGEGAAPRPAVLLVMGLGMQLTAWPPAFAQALLDAGFRVISFDNRDVGLSQKLDHLGKPNVLWESLKYKLGLKARSSYSLQDMAADALGVLDALQVRRAHVVGVSMGGMIAQRIALAAPERVLSLTSIMSSSGARGLPQARPEVLRALLVRPKSTDQAAVVEHLLKLLDAIGSPDFEVPQAEMRERITTQVERSFSPVGTLRQLMAVVSDGSRALELSQLQCPTLVLHGKADPLVPYACGEDTARRIPGARLVGFDGMGHDLPPGVVSLLLQELIPFLQQSGAAASA